MRRQMTAWSWTLAAIIGWLPSIALAQGQPAAFAVNRASPAELRALDQQVDQMVRSVSFLRRKIAQYYPSEA